MKSILAGREVTVARSRNRAETGMCLCVTVPAPREKLESSTIDSISLVITDTSADDAAFQLVFLIWKPAGGGSRTDFALVHLESVSR